MEVISDLDPVSPVRLPLTFQDAALEPVLDLKDEPGLNVKAEDPMDLDTDPEPDPPDPDSEPMPGDFTLTSTHSKMFANCIFCFNLLPLPGSSKLPRHRASEDGSPVGGTASELDDRYFDTIDKYLHIKLEDPYSRFVDEEDLPPSTSPFCSGCLRAMESLQQLDDKLQLIQAQIASRVEFLTNNIIQSKDKDAEVEPLAPEPMPPTVAATKVFTDLRKKVLGRFCPKVRIIAPEPPQTKSRRSKRKRTPRKRVAAQRDSNYSVSDCTEYPSYDVEDVNEAGSDGNVSRPSSPKENTSLAKRLRQRKPAETEYITVEPEIFIKEEVLSEEDEPEPEEEDTSDVNFPVSNEEESDSDASQKRRRSLRNRAKRRLRSRKIYIRPEKKEMEKYKLVTTDDGKYFCADIELIAVTGGYKCGRCGDQEGKIFGTLFKVRAHAVAHMRNIQCDICGKNFSLQRVLRKHLQRVHENRLGTECDICARPFKSTKAMLSHRWIHQSEEEIETAIANGVEPPGPPDYRKTVGEYPCEICGTVLKSKGSLSRHVNNHVASKNSTCEVCGKVFSANGLRDHKRYCHNTVVPVTTNRVWPCSICEKTYSTERNLRRHRTIHNNVTVLCEVCQKPMKGDKGLPGHIWTHKSEQEKKDHVAAGFRAPVIGKDHYRKQIGEFPCHVCQKILTSKGALVKHIRRHTEIQAGNTHLCSDCGKVFSTVEDLKSHQRYIHVVVDDRKHYVCKTCGMRFAVESRLKLHEMKHTGEKPFSCHICPKAYRRPHLLKKHLQAHEAGVEGVSNERSARPRSATANRPRKSRAKAPRVPETAQSPSTSNSSEYQHSEPQIPHAHASSYHQYSTQNLVTPPHINYPHPHPHPFNVPLSYDPLNYTTNYIYQGGFNPQ